MRNDGPGGKQLLSQKKGILAGVNPSNYQAHKTTSWLLFKVLAKTL